MFLLFLNKIMPNYFPAGVAAGVAGVAGVAVVVVVVVDAVTACS